MISGLGVRPELFAQLEQTKPELAFIEAHTENYFGESLLRSRLLDLRQDYAVSLHGVGLSLGRADDLDQSHLQQLKELVAELEPIFVSEHLAWSAYSHRHVPDLLPLPLTEAALMTVCWHVDEMQTVLGQQIFVENPSNYLVFDRLQIPEPEFLNELSSRTGCGLLLDVNNVHVSASNVGRDAKAYLSKLNSDCIGQYHLAGYTPVEREVAGVKESLLIDTHNQPIHDPVWDLFDFTLERHGARPTLIEWDSDFPEFSVLLDECSKANLRLSRSRQGELRVQPTIYETAGPQGSLADQQSGFLDALFYLETELENAEPAHKHRIWVYQNNVFAAIQDYLAEVFPATRGVVGADFFKQMAQAYLQTSPPGVGNIHLYGVDFDQVVSRFDGLANLSYLIDVIHYEWALHTAYFAKVSEFLDPSSVEQAELLVMPVTLNESVKLIQSTYPIFEIHRQSLPSFEDQVTIDLAQSQDDLLVYKVDHKVNTKQLSSVELNFIETLRQSDNLLQVIEVLGGSLTEQDLASCLALVFNCKLLAPASASDQAPAASPKRLINPIIEI